MTTNHYSVTYRNGYFAVVELGTYDTVEEHRTLPAAKQAVLRLTAAAVRRRPELDDLIRAGEEAAGPNN